MTIARLGYAGFMFDAAAGGSTKDEMIDGIAELAGVDVLINKAGSNRRELMIGSPAKREILSTQ